jgi:hypothetical protein
MNYEINPPCNSQGGSSLASSPSSTGGTNVITKQTYNLGARTHGPRMCFALFGQQKGQWLPGQFGLNAGVIPEPGITYAN